MSSLAPPGYASEPRAKGLDLAAPVAICVFAAAALLVAFYEVAISAPRAYSRLSSATPFGVEAALAAALATWLVRRTKTRPRAATAFAAAACFCALSAHVLAFAFAHGAWLPPLEHAVPLAAGALFGVCAAALWGDTGPELAQLDALGYLINPFRLALSVAACVAILLLFPPLGILRRAALLAALLSAASVLLLWVERLFGKLRGTSLWQATLIALAPFAALASLLGAHVSVPLAAMQHHPGDVTYVLRTSRAEHVLSRSQGGMLLFSDDVLALTSNDGGRFAEALVHPALSLASRRARVLALDDGCGPVVRELLRWPDVREVRLVPHDPALARFARQNPWLEELGSNKSSDPRVRLVEREAMPFVLASHQSFDVVLLNMGDPSSYRSGKYFTRFWFEALRARLAPGGVLGVQTTSPFRTPGAHASIVETLRSAGYQVESYDAALPTLGEWGFALAFVDERALADRLAAAVPIPDGTRYVSSRTLETLFRTERERTSERVVNHLWEQPVVELYREEDRKLSE
jgi:spermidine synthase